MWIYSNLKVIPHSLIWVWYRMKFDLNWLAFFLLKGSESVSLTIPVLLLVWCGVLMERPLTEFLMNIFTLTEHPPDGTST